MKQLGVIRKKSSLWAPLSQGRMKKEPRANAKNIKLPRVLNKCETT